MSSPNIFNRRVNVRHGIRRLFVIALLIYSVRYVSGLLRLTESRPAMPFLSPAMKTDTVRRGRFLKSVPAYGEIRTFRPGVVYNQCRYWPRTIVELVPEGSMVKEGDVLCVLDASEIRSKLQEQTLLLIKARAGHANALALESLQEIQNDRRLNTNSNLADESRGRFIAFDKAESIQELQKLQCDVEFCKESLAVSRESYERTRDFSARGFASLAELEIRRTEFQSDERELAIAEGLLNLASSFQHVRKNAELKFNSELADEELRRTQLQNELASMIQEVKSLEMEQWVSGVQLSVDYLSRALEACTIRAPRSGELIFCHKPDEGRFVEVGGKAHYSQELFWIADRSRLIVAGRVSDTRVNELEEGCVADVRVPTLPDREYCGRLRWIAPIPSPMSPFVPHDLYHDVQIELEGDPESLSRLALGATAACMITAVEQSNVLQIPVGAVFRHRGQLAVLVRTEQNLVCRFVQLGRSNDLTVEVLDGLSEGETVIIDEQDEILEMGVRIDATVPVGDDANDSASLGLHKENGSLRE